MRVAFCLCVALVAVACAESNADGADAAQTDGAMQIDASVADSSAGDAAADDAAADDANVGDLCALPPVAGSCEAYFERYYFNAESGACEKFVYGGCGGNANNFETQAECESACGMPDDAGEPIDPGCPPNSKYGTGCAECGPTDACLKTESKCFPICDTSADCEGTGYFFCSDHACVNVCG
jgi:hypothetical protein